MAKKTRGKAAPVRFAVNKQTALAVIRALRASGPRTWGDARVELASPDPGSRGRWSNKSLDLSRFGLPAEASREAPVCVAVPSPVERLRVTGALNTVYAKGLPREAFVDAGDGVAAAGPELLFVEMSTELSPIEHLLLGMELCGTYALDAANPQGAEAHFGLAPATTVAKLSAFMDSAKGVNGVNRARKTLARLIENAWSPMEAVVAALLVLPVEEDGYALGPIVLNARVPAGEKAMQAQSRVPDIMFAGSRTGLNYDGEGHIGSRAIAAAASAVAAHPEDAAPARALDWLIAESRARVVADKRRDRDLSAAGLTVLCVTKEDLYEQGGLDFVVLQALDLIESQLGRDLSLQRELLRLPYTRRHRQNLIWSLLPGPRQEAARAWLAEQEQPVGPREVTYYVVRLDSAAV